jgi:hypothetical protein
MSPYWRIRASGFLSFRMLEADDRYLKTQLLSIFDQATRLRFRAGPHSSPSGEKRVLRRTISDHAIMAATTQQNPKQRRLTMPSWSFFASDNMSTLMAPNATAPTKARAINPVRGRGRNSEPSFGSPSNMRGTLPDRPCAS